MEVINNFLNLLNKDLSVNLESSKKGSKTAEMNCISLQELIKKVNEYKNRKNDK